MSCPPYVMRRALRLRRTGAWSGGVSFPIAKRDPLPKKSPWRNIVFGHFRNTEMARDARYKLVLRNDGKGPNELFDVTADPRRRPTDMTIQDM